MAEAFVLYKSIATCLLNATLKDYTCEDRRDVAVRQVCQDKNVI